MERLREEEGLIARFEKCLRLERNWLTCNAKIGEGRDMCKKLEDMTKNCFSPLVAPEQYQAVLDCGMKQRLDPWHPADCSGQLNALTKAYNEFFERNAQVFGKKGLCYSEMLAVLVCRKACQRRWLFGLLRDRNNENYLPCVPMEDDVAQCGGVVVCAELWDRLRECRDQRHNCDKEQHDFDVCSHTSLAYMLATLRFSGLD